MSQKISQALQKLDLMIDGAAAPAAAAAAGGSASVAPLSTDAGAAGAAAPLGSLRQRLSVAFQQSLDTAYPGLSVTGAGAGEGEGPVVAQVVQCGQPKYGDYQCNNAMALFARLKGQVGGCGAVQGGGGGGRAFGGWKRCCVIDRGSVGNRPYRPAAAAAAAAARRPQEPAGRGGVHCGEPA